MLIRSGKKRFLALALVIIGAGTCLGAEPCIMRNQITLFTPSVISEPAVPARIISPIVPERPESLVFSCATNELWQYLRKGLNYLESPRPLDDPESVPPSYAHPDGRGFGCYGFSPEAYQDVQRLYPFFRDIPWERILASHRLYDLANQAFCDWLLKNLRDYCPQGDERSDVFDVVQKAWNLGLSGFKKGRMVVSSRMRRAEEFKSFY